MHFTLSFCFMGIFVVGAFASTDLLSDIPKELLKKIFGNINGLTYDIEKQEVIELPIKYESVPIEMNNGQPTASQPPPLITKVQATEEPSKEYPTISDQPKENTLKYEDTPKEELPEENVTLFDVRSAQFLYDDAKDK